jgi:tetratricopeptide (TPR) repeat protein
VLHHEPARPTRLWADVPVDLETICLKCLQKEPGRRYASAAALAEDLRRFQAGEPILARAVGKSERLRRWCRRKPALAGLIATLLLMLLGGGLTAWYLTAERLHRAAVLAERRAYVNREVADSLETAVNIRMDLQQRLQDPGRAQELQGNLDQWHEALRAAQALCERNRTLARREPDLLDERLAMRLADLEKSLDADEQTWAMAKALDDIRLEPLTPVEGKLDLRRAAQEYPKVFAGAGLSIDTEDLAGLAKRVARHPARYALVAALDHWAHVTKDVDRRRRLLEVARQADPHLWRNRFRDVRVWNDLETLQNLAKELRPENQSPQVVLALATALEEAGGDPTEVLRRALQHHPRDFWLYFSLATSTKLRVERVSLFQAALALRPHSALVRSYLANALRLNHQLEDTAAQFRIVLEAEPNFAMAHNGLGLVLHDKGDIAAALAQFRTALQLDSRYVAAHNNLGRALVLENQPDEAVAELRTALRIDPGYATAHQNLGWIRYRKKDLDGAIDEYRQAIRLDPKLAQVYSDLGRVLQAKKDLEGAIAQFRTAIRLDTEFALAYNNLGFALYEKKDLKRAVTQYRTAAQLDPSLVLAHYNLATALREDGDPQGASEAFRRVIQLDPGNRQAHLNLGQLLADKRDFDAAIVHYRKSIELNPTFDAYTCLGGAFYDKGDMTGAVTYFRKAVELEPDMGMGHNNLGAALRSLKDLDGAIRQFRSAVRLNPNLALARTNLGLALRDKNDLDGALTQFRLAVRSDPKNGYIYADYSEALLQKGEFAEARHATMRSLELIGASHALAPACRLRLQQCERMLTGERKLADFLSKGQMPTSAVDRLELANLCRQYKYDYLAAVRLYQATFTTEPGLAEDSRKAPRFDAARSAVLAAGKESDRRRLTAQERVRLRAQALSWLQADLTLLEKRSRSGRAADVLVALERLPAWKHDPDLACIREPAPLAALPDSEQAAWRTLWAGADKLLDQVRAGISQTVITGTLTETQPRQTHEFRGEAGKTYLVDLSSTAFDAYLQHLDGQGKLLAENDDRTSATRDARLIIIPSQAGVVQIVATSFRQQGRGAYQLTIRAIGGK